jgi:hypothetical protein
MEHPPRNEGSNVEDMIRAVQGLGHEKWRAGRRKEDGSFEPRLKPLDPERDQEWMDAHGDLIDGGSIDIANLTFEELPPSHQEDTKESFRFAFKEITNAARNGSTFDQNFIDGAADVIHQEWINRNRARVEKDIAELEAKGDPKSLEDAERRRNQLKPYWELATDQERQYDRDYVELALAEYKKH